ncbi:MAG: biotin transporter BioY [Thermoflavifilum sp.]|nr:biotin transporter BioY [Thermoflavifilum sp.]MCL6515222.1 biotin transporter BioY [Alicyclobacillus sp.]
MAFRLTVRGVVFAALFAALLAVLSFATVPLTIVPITLENMAVMLAGALLGPWYGFFSMLLVVVLTALGVPMLHGSGGVGILNGPTGGYVMIWPLCALLTGLLMPRSSRRGLLPYVWAFVAIELGALFCYVGGVGWLMHKTGMSLAKAMAAGCYPFLLGDTLKAVVTALISVPVRRVYPPERLVGGQAAQVVSLSDQA